MSSTRGGYVEQLLIPMMNKGEDTDTFITTLETVLERRGVDKSHILDYLITKLSGVARSSVGDVLLEDGCTYGRVFEELRARMGVNPMTA